ncbi:MAG: peptidoglycan-associated lipoprotein Pal [Gammaproteobacteria bacterium]|nr:peptidoglycan-associated lipoprotein Pal [Gammaproteobacteria bacterium]
MKNILAAILLLALLGACKSAPPPASDTAGDMTPKSPAAATAQPDDSADAISAGEVGQGGETSVVLPAELAGRTVIYFAFDSEAISEADLALLAAHARFMAGKPGVRVRLEGHTDERGTREYNIGLGERRAQAVRRALGLQGVTEARLSTVTYGEERPAVAGDDEAAYSKNRRVELVYTSG